MIKKALTKSAFLVIGIEDKEVKLMEMEFKRKLLNVRRALIFSISSIEELATSLMEKIKKDGYSKKTVIFLLPFSKVGNFTLSLPPMPKSEIKNIVERELRKNFPSLDDVCYEFFVTGTRAEGEEKRKEIVVTYVKRDYIDLILKALDDSGLTPAIITSPFQAYHNILTFSKLSKPGISTAFLDISESKASLILFRENIWFISRDFTLESLEDISSLEKLFIEINRALHYFKQKNRGLEINQLILGGSSPALMEINEYLLKNLRIPVLQMNWELIKDFMVSPSFPPDELNYFANSFFLLIGASLNYFVKDAINFIPKELFEKRMLRHRLGGLGISAMMLLLIIIFAHKYLGIVQSSYNESLNLQNRYLAKLSSQMGEMNFSKNERILAFKSATILQSPFKYSAVIYEFLRQLSLIIPDEIMIDYLESQKTESGFKFSFDGSIRTSDPLSVQEIFAGFTEKIKGISFVENLNISSLQVKTNPMESSGITMIFKIQGELKI
ncbi:MAG: hypothetical protein ACUVUG_00750 [Candidatus Aminicenantia bacterium]